MGNRRNMGMRPDPTNSNPGKSLGYGAFFPFNIRFLVFFG